jgi:hypothetical protein
MNTTREQGNRRHNWRELVAEQVRSGLGVRAFCRDRGLSTSCFYARKKQLGCDEEKSVETREPMKFLQVKFTETVESIPPSLVAEPIPPSFTSDAKPEPSSAWIAASKPPAIAAPIELRLPHGRSLMVACDFDAIHLQRLLAVLESAEQSCKLSSIASRIES